MSRLTQRLRRFLDPLNYLRFLEQAWLLRPAVSEKPVVFILGLPRSGTTLVYQYLVHRLQVAYFTNGVGKYPHAALLMTWWERKRYGEYRSDFQSQYGKMIGPVSPREAGGFWARFFDLEQYTRFEQVSPARIRILQRTIAGVQHLFGDVAFVNKNVKHMLRLDALARIFPHALFLIVERELPEVALSVLRGRYANLADPHAWWSVRPPDYPSLKDLSLPEQIAGQVRGLARQMDADLAQIPATRVVRVAYSAFCQEPERLIATLRPLLGHPTERNPPVSAFPISHNTPKTPEEEALLRLLSS